MKSGELSREEFEKWATSGNFAEVPFLILKDSYGNYIAGETEDLWEAAKHFYAAASGEALRWIPEKLAERFHETYERLAPQFYYETRKQSSVPWALVPEKNKHLMIAVCAEILAAPDSRPSTEEK